MMNNTLRETGRSSNFNAIGKARAGVGRRHELLKPVRLLLA